MSTPQTKAGKALLAGHGHHLVTEPLEDDEWCSADDEPWPCPFAIALAAIEAEARAAALADAKAALLTVCAAGPVSRSVEYLRGFADAVSLAIDELETKP